MIRSLNLVIKSDGWRGAAVDFRERSEETRCNRNHAFVPHATPLNTYPCSTHVPVLQLSNSSACRRNRKSLHDEVHHSRDPDANVWP